MAYIATVATRDGGQQQSLINVKTLLGAMRRVSRYRHWPDDSGVVTIQPYDTEKREPYLRPQAWESMAALRLSTGLNTCNLTGGK